MPAPIRIPLLLCLALLCLALCAAHVHAAAPAPANCALAAPPADAGVDHYLGMLLKIHPRNPDIGPDYAGCQTLWAQSADGWETITVAHYEHGHVVRVDSPAQPGDPVEQCVVRDGVVANGDPVLCAQLDDMRFESLPADCVDAGAGDAQPVAARTGHCVRR